MSRTGLSPADIAESFRNMCGDGSVEWVYTPTQTWVLLDAADMLDENDRLRQAFHETLARLIAANDSTEVNYMDEDYCDLLRELGMEVGEWANASTLST